MQFKELNNSKHNYFALLTVVNCFLSISDIMHSPVFMNCCKRMIACEEFMDTWLKDSEDKLCPKCRTPDELKITVASAQDVIHRIL